MHVDFKYTCQLEGGEREKKRQRRSNKSPEGSLALSFFIKRNKKQRREVDPHQEKSTKDKERGDPVKPLNLYYFLHLQRE